MALISGLGFSVLTIRGKFAKFIGSKEDIGRLANVTYRKVPLARGFPELEFLDERGIHYQCSLLTSVTTTATA